MEVCASGKAEDIWEKDIYAQSKIACVPFAQSRKRNQKRFCASLKIRPVNVLAY